MTKRKILAILSICLLAVSNTSLAGERTEREMLAIANRQLSGPAMARGEGSSKAEVEKLLDRQQYCVYGNKEHGFVIVSRNDGYEPVLGYSTTTFDAGNLPCGLVWWMETMEQAMMTKQSAARVISHETVPSFVTTLWGQGDPYNFLTPTIDNQHTPTGCVATAMAQMMKYFNYPAQGKGKGYYTLGNNTTRITEFINGIYDWDNMLDDYRYKTITDEQRMAIATLMRDAGIATYMNYGVSGSGSYETDATRGFAQNFSYDEGALRCYHRDFFSDDEWMTMIYDELANRKPILYTGADAGVGGHAFVFDGIDADGLVHVNWGWNGECNGFYSIDNLSPVDVHNNSQGNFTSGQSMVFGLSPEPTAENQHSMWCTNEVYTLTGGKKNISVNATKIYNYHFQDYTGCLYLRFENTDGISDNDWAGAVTQSDTYATFWGITEIQQMLFTTKVKAGNYRVFLASKDDNETEYQPVRCLGGSICYPVTINADGTMTIGKKEMMVATNMTPVMMQENRAYDSRLYDLQGRQLSVPTQKGIYIMNGKKVVK